MNGETKAKLSSQLKSGATFGVGAVSVGGMLMLLMQDAQLAREFGPYFVITLGLLAIAVLVINKAVPLASQFVQTQWKISENMGKMAAATQVIASKDDQRAREQDLRLSYLAANSDAVLKEIREVKKRLPAQGGPASGGPT